MYKSPNSGKSQGEIIREFEEKIKEVLHGEGMSEMDIIIKITGAYPD